MRTGKSTTEQTRETRDNDQFRDLARAIPMPVSALSVSGTYRLSADRKLPLLPIRETATTAAISAEAAEHEYLEPELFDHRMETLLSGPQVTEEVRLDVDGQYPQMTASGVIALRLAGRIDWIARLKATGRFSWKGTILQKQGDVQLFPYSNLQITVTRSLHSHQRRATVVFSGNGVPDRVRAFRFQSEFFKELDFEIDTLEGTPPIAIVDTAAHPNRPDSLPVEILTVDTIFRRAGLRTVSGNETHAPIPGAATNAAWSDMELHDSVQHYWARHGDRPAGALWTLQVPRHTAGTNIAGVVFGGIGTARRAGVALIADSFVAQAPTGDPNGEAYINRARFLATIHEIGRAADVGPSWESTLQLGATDSWITPAADSEARSFMNSPYAVSGGQASFFSDFEYRFSDSELLAVRHAPKRHHETGLARWFDQRGFDQAVVSPDSAFRLEVQLNRATALEFMEPANLELRLTNVSDQLQLVSEDLLANGADLTVVVRRQGQHARSFLPFTQHFRKAGNRVLRTGQSLHESLFLAADRCGWLLAEPGNYAVQVCLHLGTVDIVSNALALRISPPENRQEEVLAQDYFSDEVARALAFDGTRQLANANATLSELTGQLRTRRVALHALIALHLPALSAAKRLDLTTDAPRIVTAPADTEKAFTGLDAALGTNAASAVDTLGAIDYSHYLQRYCEALEKDGRSTAAETAVQALKRGRAALAKHDAPAEILDPIDSHIARLDRKTKAA